ncbi:MAG: NAD-glutamate dehydrogenase [Actinomycetales bacterium]|nr:NAD-glutamate dehydrogenase [Actinomycetales bacterium]
MTDAAELIRGVDTTGREPDFPVLARRFYRHVTAEDLGEADPQRMLDDLEAVLAVAVDRPSGHAKVVVRSEPETAVTAVLIATDDMPFLVDSITGALAMEGRTVRLVIHPQLVVRRDAAGRLIEVLDLDVDQARPADALAESWMRIEVERDFVREDDRRTADHLRRVLHDVRSAVQDWAAMQAMAQRIAAGLDEQPPAGLPADDVEDARDLLRWMADERFVFLGYREYELSGVKGVNGVADVEGVDALVAVPGSGLGILTDDAGDAPAATASQSFSRLPASVRAKAREPRLLVLTKANSRSTVHRPGYLDYVGIKVFDETGAVVGERRFLGLFSAAAYSESVTTIPVLRRRVERVMEALDLVPGSHSARDLRQFLETYPRDELFQTHAGQLIEIAASVLHLQERRHTKLYVRIDDYARFVSCLVYLPRDRYNTATRLRVERVLAEAFDAVSADHTALVTESILARVHYVLHVRDGIPEVDLGALEEQVAQAVQNWSDDFVVAVLAEVGQAAAPELLHGFQDAFPRAYQDEFDAATAVADARSIMGLQPGELALELTPQPDQEAARRFRFKVIRVGAAMSLSRILPTLQALGVDVLDERPYEINRKAATPAWILDFGLEVPAGPLADARGLLDRADVAERLTAAFRASWFGDCETDPFNGLVLRAGLTWQQVAILRAYARYMRQIGSTFGQDYIQQVLLSNPGTVRLLVELFEAQFAAPQADAIAAAQADEEAIATGILARIEAALNEVSSLDHDRILRSMCTLIRATVRTNAFAEPRGPRTPLSFKLNPRAVPEIPLPRPMFEIWVYSPRVEGVHLRFGPVARGGLRWSDRREDFRTEILGLVKAQEVKNAVIVPVGAKGGFVPARLPDPATDREGWLAEGQACYREFIGGLLDITDNLVSDPQGRDRVVPPAGVVRRDGDDPYLVVAADKGTATFSDIANGIAEEYRFWLGDAFASGGSKGYDHKAMGITARGAWESVQRHFRELGMNTQTDDFTCIGIGDMSGDVFGNGMLLSEHTALIAAFDHRDIFIDPSPNLVRSFAERARLFALPRSSWADFDPSAISDGGGVYARSAKSISLPAPALQALGLPDDTGPLAPNDVIRAILRAPVDLFWNGGIGTYVKARTQSNADVGDKANDAIRVNGDELRCRVVGEGGNLGLTQLGRIEAARCGIRLNTDAIDNSAGVDTSDHEVNIKILLDAVVRSGRVSQAERDALLVQMTDLVAEAVLADNYAQNVALGTARAVAPSLVTVHQRMIRELERQGILDRAIEYLPDSAELETRRMAGQGLTSPELAVLLAYAKIALTKELDAAGLGDDPWYAQAAVSYFPRQVRERFAADIDQHPLRSQIISTVTCNQLVNIGGITFVFRAMEETGASAVEVVHAASAALAVFDLASILDAINGLDNRAPTTTQTALHLMVRRLLDRATRWFLQSRGGHLMVSQEVQRFAGVVRSHAASVPDALRGSEAQRFRDQVDALVQAGAPADLAGQVAALLDVFSLLDITEVCARTGEDASVVIPLYFSISERYAVDRTLLSITALPRGDRWSALARQALRSDLYAVIAALTERVLHASDARMPVDERIAAWERANSAGLARTRATLQEIAEQEEADLATLSVALRVMRNLVSAPASGVQVP